MPKRPDIQRVLIVGSGPIVIGQTCQFCYSGTQAFLALREEGVRVVRPEVGKNGARSVGQVL